MIVCCVRHVFHVFVPHLVFCLLPLRLRRALLRLAAAWEHNADRWAFQFEVLDWDYVAELLRRLYPRRLALIDRTPAGGLHDC